MTDLIFLATIVAFFALMVAFVRWCEHIVGAEDVLDAVPAAGHDDGTDTDATVLEEVTA